jgi:hypothetical protein
MLHGAVLVLILVLAVDIAGDVFALNELLRRHFVAHFRF